MISEYQKKDVSRILYIINNASLKYKGVIPDNCWHEPYMSEKELINEFNNGVSIYGYDDNKKLMGVIGAQKIKDVILIRHAYTLTSHQRRGVGSILIKFLINNNKNVRLLVGTWKNATWAIRFYEKFGFILQSEKKKKLLLKKYWQIPLEQIINSVVLEKYN